MVNIALTPPPFSESVEKTVLASLLVVDGLLDVHSDHLHHDLFYTKKAECVFKALQSLYNRGSSVDVVLLAEECKRLFTAESDALTDYVATLLEHETVLKIGSLIKILRDKYQLRRLIDAANRILAVSVEADADAKEILEKAEADIFEIGSKEHASRPEALSTLLGPTIEKLGRDIELVLRGGMVGITTGYPSLDEAVGGWHSGDVTIIGARPGIGKTSLGLALALNSGVPTAFFSLEMPKNSVVKRLLSIESLISGHALKNARLSKADLRLISDTAGRLYPKSIYVDDTPGLKVPALRSKLRALKRRHDVKLCVIDHLQLMGAVDRRFSRTEAIEYNSGQLKEIAKELDLHVIALAQINRETDRTKEKPPMLADLKGSGAIEQDADNVLFLHRTSTGLQLIIAKQRDGQSNLILPVEWYGLATKVKSIGHAEAGGF